MECRGRKPPPPRPEQGPNDTSVPARAGCEERAASRGSRATGAQAGLKARGLADRSLPSPEVRDSVLEGIARTPRARAAPSCGEPTSAPHCWQCQELPLLGKEGESVGETWGPRERVLGKWVPLSSRPQLQPGPELAGSGSHPEGGVGAGSALARTWCVGAA